MNENNKKHITHKVFATISFLISIVYLSYSIIKTDSIMTNITALSIPILIFLISLVVFISSLKSTEGKLYIVISLILMLFMGFYFSIDKKIILLPQEEKMTSYKNKSYSSFSDWAKANGIEVITEYEYSDEIEKGNIIRTDINEGTFVKNIKKITVTVSDGPDYDKLLIIPSMLGWNVDDVINYVNENFLINVTINYEESDSERDIIFKQSKNGELRRSDELIFTASIGNIDDLPETVEMIDLKNKSLFETTIWLKRNNIKYELEYEFSDEISKNTVINQNIESGKEINIKTDTVIITLSKGKSIIVPDLTTMTVEEITDWIIKNNLKIEFEEIYDEKIETGKVIKQSIEKDSQIASDTLITVTISRGQIKMQNFSSLFEFKEWANKYNIKYSESYEYSNSVEKGKVISYSYKENEIVDPDAVIYVKVSLGKAISIPSFIGKTKSEAQSTCNNLGIKCSFKTGTYTNYDNNVVYVQSRNVGAKVASGSTITLTFSLGKPTTWKLAILQNELSIGNADATINSLRNAFASRYPGVTFKFQKVKDNTYNSGLVSPNSPTKVGASIKQGNTYTIYIVSN